MTLPRRGSRKVTVDEVKYRWMASAPHYTVRYGPFIVSFHAHVDKEPADSILEVLFHDSHCNSVTPEIARVIVRNARAHGWDPTKKGTFRVSPDEAVEYLGA